jgi:hypothetical protein
MPRSRTLALMVGGLAALAITGVAMAHPGLGLVDRVDVLARALGVSPDEVEQARDDGTLRDLVGDLTLNDLTEAYALETDEAIDQALADGSITPEQAERLSELSADQPFGRFHGRLGGFEGFDREAFSDLRTAAMAVEVDRLAVYAGVLGMTTAEVEAAIEDGSLREVHSKVEPVDIGALVDARDAAIEAALAAGDITAEQAELLRETSLNGRGGRFHGGFRGRGGFGGFGAHGRFGAPADGTSTGSDASISI